MTCIEVNYQTTVVYDHTSVLQSILAAVPLRSQAVTIEDVTNAMTLDTPLPCELSPDVLILANVDVSVADFLRARGYQRVYVKSPSVYMTHPTEIAEVSLGVYSWDAPAIPVHISCGAARDLMNIVYKFIEESHSADECDAEYARGFIEHMYNDTDVYGTCIDIAGSIFGAQKIAEFAIRGIGRIHERHRILTEFAKCENLPSTIFDDEITVIRSINATH